MTPLGVLLGIKSPVSRSENGKSPVSRSEEVNALALASRWGCRLTIHGLALVLAKVVTLETEGPTLEWVPTEIWLSSETGVAIFENGVPFELIARGD